MKLRKYSLMLLAMLTMGIIFASCTGRNSKSAIEASDAATGCDISNFEIYEEFKTASAAYLCKGDTTFGKSVKVYTTASISVQWPRRFGDSDVKSLQDTILAHSFVTPKASIDSCIVDFISRPIGYGEYALEKVDFEPVFDENTRVLSTNTSVKSVGFCEKYVVFKVEHDEYRGGAHPSYFASFINYDLKNKRVANFNSLFKDNCDAELLEILKQSLISNYFCANLDEVAEKSGIFINDLFVSHEIYLTGDEVVFFYNPYEIGPWAIGTVEIPVPVATLSECLSDYGKQLYDI